MKKVKSLVVTGYGINCEGELAAAYQLAGAEAQIVHLNDVFLGKVKISDYDILNFPGGFSFGDDLGSGKVLANKMKYKRIADGELFYNVILEFIEAGKFVLGICNGFQFLVKMGLLPNVAKEHSQEVTLTLNDSGKFEDRWVYCRTNPASVTPFLKGIDKTALPVRHGEGKLIIRDEQILNGIIEKNLNCLSYTDFEGNITAEYPYNPNGSYINCAGLCDETGQVFGLMPHPEAYLSIFNHPDWGRKKRMNPEMSEDGEGLEIFKNIVEHIKNR
ncbi:MAG: phosphoribosylformylglycinamidine synthase subunit PurQ [Candidatus Stygibacter australis]|nr:phosphoribosylformylglycinamidine synthase subunit PurQ [Candidatus Stygibacter australis]MDP8323470.1 phosphoribosylformylglycinamidine synthase subunit PurQ [Candidatus Stygibacter australis]